MTEHAAKRFISRWEHELRGKLSTGLTRYQAAEAILQGQPQLVLDFLAASLDLIAPDERRRRAEKGLPPL